MSDDRISDIAPSWDLPPFKQTQVFGFAQILLTGLVIEQKNKQTRFASLLKFCPGHWIFREDTLY